MSDLTDAELERYARHIVLREVGGEGQKRLAAARVAVVGAGGLGAPLIAYLAIGWLATEKPGDLYVADPEDRAFWQKTRAAPGRTIREVRS
ncbi:MAG: ThiF family adenylyltransferase, partial [Dietzia cercidiphylli]